MKKSCNRYRPEDISLFVDTELPQSRYLEIEHHLHNCPDCNRLVEQYKTLSIMFKDHVEQKKLKINPDTLKQRLVPATPDLQKISLGNRSGFFGKNIYLKLASIAAILMISLFTFQKGIVGNATGPSAIVTSVDTDVSSVMIIETQKERHTIIWFSET